jgi:hypothetical protein
MNFNDEIYKKKYLKYKTKYSNLKYQQDNYQIAGSPLKNGFAIIISPIIPQINELVNKDKIIKILREKTDIINMANNASIVNTLKQTATSINGLIIYKNDPTKIYIIEPINNAITSYPSNIDNKADFDIIFEGVQYHSKNVLKGKGKAIIDICNKYFLNRGEIFIIGIEVNRFWQNECLFFTSSVNIKDVNTYLCNYKNENEIRIKTLKDDALNKFNNKIAADKTKFTNEIEKNDETAKESGDWITQKSEKHRIERNYSLAQSTTKSTYYNDLEEIETKLIPAIKNELNQYMIKNELINKKYLTNA